MFSNKYSDIGLVNFHVHIFLNLNYKKDFLTWTLAIFPLISYNILDLYY